MPPDGWRQKTIESFTDSLCSDMITIRVTGSLILYQARDCRQIRPQILYVAPKIAGKTPIVCDTFLARVVQRILHIPLSNLGFRCFRLQCTVKNPNLTIGKPGWFWNKLRPGLKWFVKQRCQGVGLVSAAQKYEHFLHIFRIYTHFLENILILFLGCVAKCY